MLCPSCQATNDDAADMCFNCGRGLSGLTRGSVLVSRYEILDQLGRGGMGIVYKAHDRHLDEVVVLKLLRADLARAEGMARRFRSEIKLARRIRHPNVCAIHEFGQEGDFCFITMELVDGTDLKREIRRSGALPAAAAFDVALQLAAGLQAIHEGGIIHRDLKTANIMRDRAGRVRLMDFGIAKQVHSDSTGLTLTGQIIGTPEYMSPEQALGTPVDFRSDVYALGVVLFEILTGRVPFQGETPIATLRKQVHDPPPLHNAEAAGVPPSMIAVLARTLAKEPDSRYATAAELREALERARADWLGSRPAVTPARTAGATAPALAPAPLPQPETTHVVTPVPTRFPTAVRTAVSTAVGPRIAQARSPGGGARRWALGLGAAAALVLGVAAISRWPSGLDTAASPSPTPSPAGTATPTLASPMISSGSSALDAPRTLPPPEPARSPPSMVTRIATPEPQTAHVASPRPAPTVAGTAKAGPRPSPAAAAVPAVSPPREVVAPTPEPEPADGLLQLLVRPWAEVNIDGRTVGTTPFRPLKLRAGVHTVTFAHPDYKPFLRKVTIAAGQTTRLEIDLSWEAFRK